MGTVRTIYRATTRWICRSGKSFGDNLMVRFIGTNITNQRYQLDSSNTFGGSHWADPFMCSVQVKFRFHY